MTHFDAMTAAQQRQAENESLETANARLQRQVDRAYVVLENCRNHLADGLRGVDDDWWTESQSLINEADEVLMNKGKVQE